MKILFTERRTSRTELEKLILAEAEQLGIEVELSEPDPLEKNRVMVRHFAAKGGGYEQRSGVPPVFNDIPPELIIVAIAGSARFASAALGKAGAKAGEDGYELLKSAIVKAVTARKLGKAETLEDDDQPGYLAGGN